MDGDEGVGKNRSLAFLQGKKRKLGGQLGDDLTILPEMETRAGRGEALTGCFPQAAS